jgi:hypothetical protein
MVNSWITYCDLVLSSDILLTECQASIIFCSISFQTMKQERKNLPEGQKISQSFGIQAKRDYFSFTLRAEF